MKIVVTKTDIVNGNYYDRPIKPSKKNREFETKKDFKEWKMNIKLFLESRYNKQFRVCCNYYEL